MKYFIFFLVVVLSCSNSKKQETLVSANFFISHTPSFDSIGNIDYIIDTCGLYKNSNSILISTPLYILNEDFMSIKHQYFFYKENTVNGLFDDSKKIVKVNVDSVKKKISYFGKIISIDKDDVLIDSFINKSFIVKKYVSSKKNTDLSYPDTTTLLFSKSQRKSFFTLDSLLDDKTGFKLSKIIHHYKKERFLETNIKEDFYIKFELIEMNEMDKEAFLKKINEFKKYSN